MNTATSSQRPLAVGDLVECLDATNGAHFLVKGRRCRVDHVQADSQGRLRVCVDWFSRAWEPERFALIATAEDARRLADARKDGDFSRLAHAYVYWSAMESDPLPPLLRDRLEDLGVTGGEADAVMALLRQERETCPF